MQFKPLTYIDKKSADEARRMLNIKGPQVQTTYVTSKNNIVIVWKDGSTNLVDWPLFQAIVDYKTSINRPLVR